MERYYHEYELDERTVGIEHVLKGEEEGKEWQIGGDLKILFLPGHTQGSISIVYDDRALFSGDHVAYSGFLQTLTGHPRYNWYDKALQAQSIRALQKEKFVWLLPGHGRRYKFANEEMKSQMLEDAAVGLLTADEEE